MLVDQKKEKDLINYRSEFRFKELHVQNFFGRIDHYFKCQLLKHKYSNAEGLSSDGNLLNVAFIEEFFSGCFGKNSF